MLQLETAPTPILEALRRELGPAFVNEQQRTFMRSTAPELLYSGAFRAGKSRIGCEKAYQLARRYPGIPIGIFRKTAASLPATTERTLLHDVMPRSAIVRSNRSEHWYELANGSRIWLFGLDPDPITGIPSKVGSVELGFAFIDEAAEVTEADWIMVKGRLSWPGIPFHQIAAATNPASPTHWLKRRFTPSTDTRQFLHASTFDNPALPPDYLAEAESMGDGYFRSRYILGEWVGAEGVIWTLPDERIVAAAGPFKRTIAGLDWGFVHAFAAEVIAQTGSGRLAVIDEVYVKGRTLAEIIPALLLIQESHGIEMFYADPSEPAYILECRRAGLRITEARNDVLPGINAVNVAISQGLTVAPSCTGLLGEMPGYTWQTERGGGLREKPIDINDDACDALRYGVMAFQAAASGWGAVTGRAGGIA